MKNTLYKLVLLIQKVINFLIFKLEPTTKIDDHAINVQKWYSLKGDTTFRLNYDELNSCSIVFDLGAYEGQWSSNIFSKYLCQVYAFEPYMPFYENVKKRFKHNENIKVFPFGLGMRNEKKNIHFSDAGTSFFHKNSKINEEAEIFDFDEFVRLNIIKSIDLIKINIEGGEYDLLDYIIEKKLHLLIKNFQIQFHNKYVDHPKKRMAYIQEKLMQTHELTWQFEFVWENWKIRK